MFSYDRWHTYTVCLCIHNISKIWNKMNKTICLFTREVIKCSRDVFRRVSIRGVADHQTGFPHRSIAQQDALQQPLLRLSWPGRFGFMRRHWRGHGPTVIHSEWRCLSVSQLCTAISSMDRWNTHHENRFFPPLQFFFPPNGNDRKRSSCVKPLLLCALSNPVREVIVQYCTAEHCSFTKRGRTQSVFVCVLGLIWLIPPTFSHWLRPATWECESKCSLKKRTLPLLNCLGKIRKQEGRSCVFIIIINLSFQHIIV